MISEIIFLALILGGLLALYLLKNRQDKPEPERYVWVGPGEDPFKSLK